MNKKRIIVWFTIMSLIISVVMIGYITSNGNLPKVEASQSKGEKIGPFKPVSGLPPITGPANFNWRQYAGVTLNFISENTPPSSALAANIKEFEKATGIKVNIQQMDLGSLVQKVTLDFVAKSGRFQVIYADPYQVLAPHYQHFVDLNKFNKDPNLPHVPGGLSDFIPSQLQACGYMGNTSKLYALPYDCPTMVLAYRKDIIAKIKNDFIKEKGFDPTPGPNMTWEQYYEVAKYINEHAKELGVKYGTGHQAKQYDSLMCDFSNILAAWGGDYFEKKDLGYIGSSNPGKCIINSKQGIEAAKFYKKLLDIAHPGSKSWDWNGLAEAFAAGEIALAPEWHEFASMFENPQKSKVVGKVGWSVLPKGPVRSANIYGGTGVGINAHASEKEQKAAWLFLIWATSPQSQLMILQSPVGGETPTRKSVYNYPTVKKAMEDPTSPEAKKMPNLIAMKATLQAWEKENVYMRPKIPQWTQVDTIVFTELSKMLAGVKTPEQAMNDIKRAVDVVTKQNK